MREFAELGLDMAYSISSKGDVAVLQKLVTEKIAQGVVLLVEDEDGGVGGTCQPIISKVGDDEGWMNITGVDVLFDLLLIGSKKERLGPRQNKRISRVPPRMPDINQIEECAKDLSRLPLPLPLNYSHSRIRYVNVIVVTTLALVEFVTRMIFPTSTFALQWHTRRSGTGTRRGGWTGSFGLFRFRLGYSGHSGLDSRLFW